MNFGGVIHLNKIGVCIFCGLSFVLIFYAFSNKTDITNKSKINLVELLNVAIKAAENGGYEVIHNKDKLEIKNKGLTKEGLEDSVTTADFLSHCSMIGTLKHFYPLAKVISEEANTKCHKDQQINYDLHGHGSHIESLSDEYVDENDITIWIDPLDATREYTEKLYQFVTTMVCVAIKGKPVIGVIHKPFRKKDNTSWAWVGKAKSKDLDRQTNEKLHNKLQDTLTIIISRSHGGEISKIISKNFAGENVEVDIAAGAGYKALEVATGKADAYLHITAIKKWDICAGNAILNALGGKMTTKFNELINYSDSDGVKNEEGLIATMENHNKFVGKL